MNPYQQYIAISRYARWRDDLGRREMWPETCDRLVAFWYSRLKERHANIGGDRIEDIYNRIRYHMLNLEVMPSMRSVMTAGKALDRDNMAGYNCSAIAIDDPRAFDEIMYVLMCGTGVGFSVERQVIKQLPEIAEQFFQTESNIVVRDSKLGWASALRELITLLYAGRIPHWDVSRVRPAGAKLKVFGGRASGPQPLEDLFRFTVNLFKSAAGRRLTSIEVHDLVCKIAEVVVCGGVRRSALISLSNLSDDRMRNAKNGMWWEHEPQRALANNSAVYTERPEFEVFLNEWKSLYESRSGERGIFSRVATQKKAAENGRRDADQDFLTNPCGEIVLRSKGLCNLSEVVIRPDDTFDSLKEKVEVATILGTLQSTLTEFRYVRNIWRYNAEEERLLGVSLTGIMDHPFMSGRQEPPGMNLAHLLSILKQHAVETNEHYANLLGIPVSAAITTIKPSGTVSQLCNSASGIHPRYNGYYLRRVLNDAKDPLVQFLIDSGVPYEQSRMNPGAMVFEFPVKAPDGAICRNEVGALEQLRLADVYRQYWCEHNPSQTVYYTDDNFLGVGQWVWEHFEKIGGLSFLPTDNGIYEQAPYTDISKGEFEKRQSEFPTLDWTKLQEYEKEDMTTGTHELACTGGACEI